MLKHGFFDENIITLKLDSTASYAVVFVNENKYQNELNNMVDVLKFFDKKYLKSKWPIEGLKSEPSITIPDEFKFEILSEHDNFDLVFGKHIVYNLKFMTGLTDKVYKGFSSGKYFYVDQRTPKVYCKNLEDAAFRLFLHCTSHNKS